MISRTFKSLICRASSIAVETWEVVRIAVSDLQLVELIYLTRMQIYGHDLCFRSGLLSCNVITVHYYSGVQIRHPQPLRLVLV